MEVMSILNACMLKYKLTGKEEKIKAMLEAGTSKAEMARKLKVSRNTLAAFLNRNRTGIPSN
jgi:putative DNA-invertase from lambdoid prophage Rac